MTVFSYNTELDALFLESKTKIRSKLIYVIGERAI